jgi:hypothetical protein
MRQRRRAHNRSHAMLVHRRRHNIWRSIRSAFCAFFPTTQEPRHE